MVFFNKNPHRMQGFLFHFMPKVQCPKCKEYKTAPVGLREAEIMIFIGIGMIVLAIFRPSLWFLPIISFLAAILFYIPAIAQHYVCKSCGHRWNAEEEQSGRKWHKEKEDEKHF